MPAHSRSTAPITRADLRRLGEIARQDRQGMFMSNSNWAAYEGRLLAVTLCQGAALHYLDGRTGVKDFDVWTFFARAPGRPYPDAVLFRRRKMADFGPSAFGRTSTAPPWMAGRRVDLFARSLDVAPSSDSAEAIRRWLSDGRTPSAAKLAEKAVIEIEPRPGRIIWPPR
jgi:hypothetical protein